MDAADKKSSGRMDSGNSRRLWRQSKIGDLGKIVKGRSKDAEDELREEGKCYRIYYRTVRMPGRWGTRD